MWVVNVVLAADGTTRIRVFETEREALEFAAKVKVLSVGKICVWRL